MTQGLKYVTMELVETFLDIIDNSQWAGRALELHCIEVQSCIFKCIYSCTIFGWEYPFRSYTHAHMPI